MLIWRGAEAGELKQITSNMQSDYRPGGPRQGPARPAKKDAAVLWAAKVRPLRAWWEEEYQARLI